MSMKYLNQRAFIRALPQTKCVVLGQLEYGDTIDATDIVSGMFRQIKMNDGRFGWVHRHCLSDIPMRVHDIICEDDNPAGNMMELANACLSKLPFDIIDYIKAHGWHILITSKDLDDYFYHGQYGGVGGVTDYANRDIYLQHVRWDIENCMYHEVGHVLDYLAGFVSDSPEFIAAFRAENANFKDSTSVGDNHEISCPREYFASVFSEMMLHPGHCEVEIPVSCKFIADFVKKIRKKT